jgi:uracil-DNA glycosylase family 4
MNDLRREMRACRRCLDQGYAIAPGAVFSGRLSAQVLLIGQAPGVTEVAAKRPFNAGSGRRLFAWLGAAGWAEGRFRTRQYMTAVTKCYPGKNCSGRGDRVPSKAEQALCRPFLEQEIRLVAPRLIIPVGGLAIKLFYPDKAKLDDIIGTAAYFPAAALTDPVNFDLGMADIVTEYDPGRPNDGRWVVSLAPPSGASLWPNRPANQRLIDRAVQILNEIRLNFLEQA